MSSDLLRVTRSGARVWYRSHPDKAARVFHNLLMTQMPELRVLLDLFGVPVPAGRGVYNHHDGLQR